MSNVPILRPTRVYWDCAVIPLTRGKVVVVDLVDSDLGQFHWYAMPSRKTPGAQEHYACRAPNGRTIYLHRVIAERSGLQIASLKVDHIDCDPLNCRRNNLRPATQGQNTRNVRVRSNNSSGVKGVSWNREKRHWRANIHLGGKQVSLGGYARKEDAAAAYEKAAKEHFGEFARTR